MDELKETISQNLVQLRTKARLTQAQLADMLNYSDKAVSKWERGESIPDLRVLIQICKIYGITLDDLVTKKDVAEKAQPKKQITGKRVLIASLSAVFVWFVATVIFVILHSIGVTGTYAWLVFIVAPLPMSIVLTVFSAKWGNRITHTVTSSMILWSCVLIVHVFVACFAPEFKQILWLYLVAAVFEVLIILWFVFRWFTIIKFPKVKIGKRDRDKKEKTVKKDTKAQRAAKTSKPANTASADTAAEKTAASEKTAGSAKTASAEKTAASAKTASAKAEGSAGDAADTAPRRFRASRTVKVDLSDAETRLEPHTAQAESHITDTAATQAGGADASVSGGDSAQA